MNPLKIKRIILGSVDYREDLKTLVKTGGIVNMERALRAAELSLTNSIEESLKLSREEIQDQERNEVNKGRLNNREAIGILPLPSLFKL